MFSNFTDVATVAFGVNGQFNYLSATDGISCNDATFGDPDPGVAKACFYALNLTSTHFQHQDWLGTERLRTSYNGSVEGTFISLPFGDGYSFTGVNEDQSHFATLDKDYYAAPDSMTDHAQFRQYSEAQGRWMSPDPYDGSYDFANPQSFNRYSYVGNNPLSFTDPAGLVTNGAYCGDNCPSDNDGFFGIFVDIGDALAGLFGFGGPSFHGSLKPRPEGTGNPDWANADGSFGETLGLPSDVNWSKINPGIAGALGLPDAGCEFGACGNIGSTFMPGAATAPLTWCGEHPTICTAGADIAAFVRAIPAVTASVLLLRMTGDEPASAPGVDKAACYENMRATWKFAGKITRDRATPRPWNATQRASQVSLRHRSISKGMTWSRHSKSLLNEISRSTRMERKKF